MFLVLLLSADLFFIGVSAFADVTKLLPGDYFIIFNEQSAGETLQYLKEFWILLACCWLGFIKAEWAWAAWAAVFGYVLVDDSLAVHENVGGWLAEYFSYFGFLGLQPGDLGELTVTVFAGAVLLPLMGAAYFFGSADFKQISKRIGALLALLVLCGVILDMGTIVVSQPRAQWVLAMAEDGGEMLAMSAICLYVVHVLVSARDAIPAPAFVVTPTPISVAAMHPTLSPVTEPAEVMD